MEKGLNANDKVNVFLRKTNTHHNKIWFLVSCVDCFLKKLARKASMNKQ